MEFLFTRRSALTLPLAAALPLQEPLQETNGEAKMTQMTKEPSNARKSFGDMAPKLAEITDKVLFGDVWEDDTLSPRERSLVTIASLISLYRVNELEFHLKKAMENGMTHDQIVATITHLAFYAGWPPAMTALNILKGAKSER